MARARDPNREIAKQMYLDSNGEMLLKDIAAELSKNEGTIRGWKNKDKWDSELNGTLQSNERNAPKEKQPNRTKKKANVEEELSLIENDNLTDKQWLFCMYYTKYWNVTKAYQKAYNAPYNQARANGSRLIAKDSVRAGIEQMKNDITSGIMIDSRAVLQKYIDIAFADIGDYLEFGEYSVRLKDLSEVDTTVIAEASNTEEGVKFKLLDKMKALNFLAKYTDLLNENELKQLKVERERIAIAKESGVEDEYEDDGFMDALKGVKVDWSDD